MLLDVTRVVLPVLIQGLFDRSSFDSNIDCWTFHEMSRASMGTYIVYEMID